MAPQLYFFTGENREEMLREKRRWTEEFMQRHGEANLLLAPASAMDFRSLIDAVASAPFLGDKRLVMIEGIPRFSADEMTNILESIHPQNLLVFLESAPDGRLAGVKALQKIATVKEFALRTGKPLRMFLMEEAKRLGTTVAPDALEHLISLVGEDEAMLATELAKLSLYAAGRSVSKDDVTLLAVAAGDREVWELSRLLSMGDAKGAMQYTRALLARGEDAHSIWNILLWVVRQFVSVWAIAQEGVKNPADIARRMQVPFPSAKTLLSAAERAKPASVRMLLERATTDDIALKTGGFRATAEAPEELLALLDLLLLRMGKVMGR